MAMICRSFALVTCLCLVALSSTLANDRPVSSVLSGVDCPNSDYFPLKVLSQATPLGNSSAGFFSKQRARDLQECARRCCLQDQCDVVFFFNKTCYHITCKSTRLCKPIKRTSKKFLNSFMVLIRSATDDYQSPDEVIPGLDYDLGDYPKVRRDEDDQQTPPSISITDHSKQTCDTLKCPPNEFCKVNGRGLSQCQCKPGYYRLEASGSCVRGDQLGSGVGSGIEIQPQTHTQTPLQHLVVSAGGNHVIQLPENGVTLSAFAVPASGSSGTSSGSAPAPAYSYQWTLVAHSNTGDDFGNMEGASMSELKLTNLKQGNYTFRVVVTGEHAQGETLVNVTVLPPQRVNHPPKAVIQPSNATVQLPNKVTVLDGSYSQDDDKIVKYEWQSIKVPIAYKNVPDAATSTNPTLQLNDLVPGSYQLKLTVTDSDGAVNSTLANVFVLKEIDYPPTANAGADVVIHLPQNEVILMGNLSTDDKGISGWQWTRAAEETGAGQEPAKSLSVDMDGTSTPFLRLSKLEVGVYKFVLKVTDTANQTSSAEVHVFVKPENDSPPVAVAGENLKLTLPITGPVLLDGSKSHDDVGIVNWQWKQVKGRSATISGVNKSLANVTGLHPGEYAFNLTVTDAKGSNATSQVTIAVVQLKNTPPVANAGGDKILVMTDDRQLIVDGSKSNDDVEIVSYLWTREPESLAAGQVIGNSSQTPVLRLADVIPGRYVFKLTVTDGQGASHSDVASVVVKESDVLLNQVEMTLNVDLKSFTVDQEAATVQRIKLMLSDDGEPVDVEKVRLEQTTHLERVMLIFVVRQTPTGHLLSGVDVVRRLKQKLRSDARLMSTTVLSVETVVCQNDCTGHGHCDQHTKRCLCEAFWMENFLRVYLGDQQTNCEWSVLYVSVIAFAILTLTTGLLWTCACCLAEFRGKSLLQRQGARRYKKACRSRYTLLDDDYHSGDPTADQVELLSSNRKKMNNVLLTDQSDSESDTIFESTARRNNLMNNRMSNDKMKNHQKSLNGLVNKDREGNLKKVRA